MINRRDFLKMGGLFSAALVVNFNPLANLAVSLHDVEFQGSLYRSASDGRILVSVNSGKTWQVHTNFGAEFSVQNLGTDFWGQMQAQLEFAGSPFDLVLAPDGATWRTT